MARIESVPEFQRRLTAAIARLKPIVAAAPEPALASILMQLEALATWTVDGAKPSASQIERLSFGQLASRHLDDLDQDLAAEIYDIASFVVYW